MRKLVSLISMYTSCFDDTRVKNRPTSSSEGNQFNFNSTYGYILHRENLQKCILKIHALYLLSILMLKPGSSFSAGAETEEELWKPNWQDKCLFATLRMRLYITFNRPLTIRSQLCVRNITEADEHIKLRLLRHFPVASENLLSESQYTFSSEKSGG